MPNYNEEKSDLLLKCKKEIANVSGKENKPTDTLITKIMLWVFAIIPAFDTYDHLIKNHQKKLKIFIKNKKDFDSFKIYTLDFFTGKKTKNIYTKAKLIDMYWFIAGQYK